LKQKKKSRRFCDFSSYVLWMNLNQL